MRVMIIGAVLDLSKLRLHYLKEGTTEVQTVDILQGDPTLQTVWNEINEPVLRGEVVYYDLPEKVNVYKSFETGSNGIIKFVKIAKSVLSGIYQTITGNISIGNVSGGSVPVMSPKEDTPADIRVQQSKDAFTKIMENAEPITTGASDAPSVQEYETVVAVVDDTFLTGVERLEDQLAHAADTQSTTGMENLLRRLAAVAQDRGHSVDDCMTFLKKIDLPFTNDGAILAYKALYNSKHRDIEIAEGTFVDCHSHKVFQRVGSRVSMSPSMVDPNRSNECSQGLHIASRSYLASFVTDTFTSIVLCRIEPEDVIAVPFYDPSKVRVCAYHILGVIPEAEYPALLANKPLREGGYATKLLAAAVAGEHIPILEEVIIGGPRGTDLTVRLVEPVEDNQVHQDLAVEAVENAAPVATISPVDKGTVLNAPPLDVFAASKVVTDNTRPPTRDVARNLFQANKWEELFVLKKKNKKSWASLGFSEKEEAKILKNKP